MKLVGSLLAGAIAVSVLVGCWRPDDSGAPSRQPASSAPGQSEEAAPGAGANDPVEGTPEGIALEPAFGEEEFDKPVGLEIRKGYSDLLYVIEQPGRIVSKSLSRPEEEAIVALDIRDRVHDEGGEQGLLGLAFDPRHPDRAYVNYTTETHTVISRFDADASAPGKLDPDSERIVLTFEQPYSNHNGGQLAFGPDGYLYIATGDGGSGGDPQNNGQNLDSLLGKILRIDVGGELPADRPYVIPADNPFLEKGRPEIYAYGLRNPWRFSFDEETGKLWAADVGQNRLEEINLVERGGNYGWRIREGTACYMPETGCEDEGLEAPLHEYGRDEGVSVTGGYVYRGQETKSLVGWYVYGDYGTGNIWALRESGDGTAENRLLLESEQNITSFGRDTGGELYLCTADGRIYRIR